MADDNENQNRDAVDLPVPPEIPEEVKILVDELLVFSADMELSSTCIDDAVKLKDISRTQAELDDIEIIKEGFNATYLRLVSLCRNLDLSSSEFDNRRAEFLLLYKKSKAQSYTLLRPMKLSSSTNSTANGDDDTSRLKLAKIEVKDFDGNLLDWTQWKTVYETFVHKSSKYSHFEKHQILRSKLKKDPYHLIEEIPLDEQNSANYEDAWQALLDQYDDPLERVSRYLLALSNPPAKPTLKSLVTHFRANAIPLRMVFQKHPEIDIFSQFMIHAFLQKADKGANLDWQRELQKKEVLSNFDEFIKFMQGRCKSYDRAMSNKASTSSKGNVLAVSSTSEPPAKKFKSSGCLYCQQQHRLHQCPDFRKLSTIERFKFVQKKQVCRKCFRGYCDRTCRFNCKECKKEHNTLIHVKTFAQRRTDSEKKPETDTSSAMQEKENPSKGKSLIFPFLKNSEYSSDLKLNSALQEQSQNPTLNFQLPSFQNENLNKFSLMGVGWAGSLVTDNLYSLLATAIVEVQISKGTKIKARSILDSASQYNFITAAFVKKYDLPTFYSTTFIKGIDQMTSSAKKSVNVTIYSCHSTFNAKLECVIIDEIIDHIPSQYFSVENWNFPSYLNLADPKFNTPQPVDILIGLGLFWKVIQPHFRNIGLGLPKLIATKLGWLVSGEMKIVVSDKANSYYNYLISENGLSETIQRFWLLDENTHDSSSFESIECERIFQNTTFRNEAGKFVVSLPFKIPPEKLGRSKPQAFKMFFYLERKLAKNTKLRAAYIEGIHDYKKKGHMELISNDLGDGCYLPHHAIVKETSTSTKIRIVFNASMPTSSGLSLNDCLMIGPVVQSDLISIMMRVRMHAYVFSADISQMYRQILVNSSDTKYQKILWRDSPDEEIKVFKLNTVSFGVSSAPFLATRCLKELAVNYGSKYPAAKSALINDFYVDDVFTGANSIKEVIEIRKQLAELLASAGFKLCKWCSNEASILEGIPITDLETNFPLHFGNELAIKTLGIIWLPQEDVFKVWVHIEEIIHPTKRQVLSIISTIFDPLGFLGPILVLAKTLMQQLWIAQDGTLGWNDLVPLDILPKWKDFSSQLLTLNQFTLPRCAIRVDNPTRIELHGFCDASESAYGAVIYLRSFSNDQVSVKLLCSKTRVAPLKKRHIAQLELCAAVLLAELFQKIITALENVVKFDSIRLWSDNTTVLCWIKSLPSKWIVFVANRVQKIQEKTKNCVWDYVNTDQNAADVLSRGLLPLEFLKYGPWLDGPVWLHNNTPFNNEVNFQPSRSMYTSETRNSKRVFCATIIKSSIFHEFSTFKKLIRSVAWFYRFCMYLDYMGPFLIGPLQCFELNHATTVLIKVVQKESFSEELKSLSNQRNIDLKSQLAALSPFLDAQGVIRVGGRLQVSELTFDQKFQIVLPSNHIFTSMLIKNEHINNFHAGPQLMRSILRRKWWILSQNRAIRSCIVKCHDCIRMKADTRTQMMANLPKARVVPHRPFLICGVDYAGPIQLLRLKDRGKVILQAYICIFVCFSTKAIHLELVSQLTSEYFIAAFKRFISRRGIPAKIYSDNGSNFQGASKQIAQMKQFLTENNDKINHFATSLEIKWRFIPPRAPHMGGLWEAGVKSVKKLMNTTLKGSKFTYEQYLTFLTQVEACLNSRPLILESSDPNEPGALTPGHFLIGGPITALPNKDLAHIPANRLKYWEQIEQKTQYFWNKWRRDYLNTLQQRSKWRQIKNNMKIGDIVLVIEENAPPTQWPLAIITALHPNSDGLVRTVTARMRTGDYKKLLDSKIKVRMSEFVRPITKLVYLPTDD